MSPGAGSGASVPAPASELLPLDQEPAEVPRPPLPHFHGHRDRLRHRYLTAGDVALSDYELLELLLFRSIPRRDTKGLAKELIRRFGSFPEVLGAPLHLLREVKGVGESVAVDLKIVASALHRMARNEVAKRPVLSSWNAVLDYVRVKMAFEEREEFRILFLDKRNALIADERQQVGTVDHTPVYPREVVRRALDLSASALILVHNHPSGDPTPSGADMNMTRELVDIAKPLGIVIHDHIIVGKHGHASFRALKLV